MSDEIYETWNDCPKGFKTNHASESPWKMLLFHPFVPAFIWQAFNMHYQYPPRPSYHFTSNDRVFFDWVLRLIDRLISLIHEFTTHSFGCKPIDEDEENKNFFMPNSTLDEKGRFRLNPTFNASFIKDFQSESNLAHKPIWKLPQFSS